MLIEMLVSYLVLSILLDSEVEAVLYELVGGLVEAELVNVIAKKLDCISALFGLRLGWQLGDAHHHLDLAERLQGFLKLVIKLLIGLSESLFCRLRLALLSK